MLVFLTIIILAVIILYSLKKGSSQQDPLQDFLKAKNKHKKNKV